IRVQLGNAVIAAQACPGVNPWPPSMSHARWVPTIPQVGTAMAVFTAPLIGSSGMAALPPLPQIGTAGRRPIPMGVPPATMVAGLSTPTTMSDDTVEMADNMSPPPVYA